ncbi:transposase (plasmid) [Escherichia coli]|nr:transposase [Escherichia coli]
MSEQKITGIDLAKTNFYLFSINAHGKPAGKTKLSRNQLLGGWLQQPKEYLFAMGTAGHLITGPGKSGNSTMM